MHRAGMFTYVLPRTIGMDPDSSRRSLARLRTVTVEGVDEHGLAWVQDLAALAAATDPPAAP
jgi:hypothetical protein